MFLKSTFKKAHSINNHSKIICICTIEKKKKRFRWSWEWRKRISKKVLYVGQIDALQLSRFILEPQFTAHARNFFPVPTTHARNKNTAIIGVQFHSHKEDEQQTQTQKVHTRGKAKPGFICMWRDTNFIARHSLTFPAAVAFVCEAAKFTNLFFLVFVCCSPSRSRAAQHKTCGDGRVCVGGKRERDRYREHYYAKTAAKLNVCKRIFTPTRVQQARKQELLSRAVWWAPEGARERESGEGRPVTSSDTNPLRSYSTVSSAVAGSLECLASPQQNGDGDDQRVRDAVCILNTHLLMLHPTAPPCLPRPTNQNAAHKKGGGGRL